MAQQIHESDRRTLVLSFGRVADGNAVCYLADASEAELVLDLLDQPHNDRLCYALQLSNFVREQQRRPVWERRSVAFRRGGGIFRLMPWRLAKWLSCALTTQDAWRAKTSAQIRAWLENSKECRIVGGAQELAS